MPTKIAQLLAIMEKYNDHLGFDEECGVSITGIHLNRIPALAWEIEQLYKEDTNIADNMRDFWKHLQSGADR